MYEAEFMEAVMTICTKDPRYDPQAYIFVREALDYTVKKLEKPAEGPGRHVSGQELLGGLRDYALQQFGPLSLTVLSTWGIKCTADFGELVFNLVDAGKLGSTEEDRKEDFGDGYDFKEVFAKPFLPSNPPPTQRSAKKRTGMKRRTVTPSES